MVIGDWSFFGHWTLVIGHSLDIGHWSLVILWTLVIGHWSFLHADGGKLRTLSGAAIDGDLAGITDKHIQWRGKDGKTADVPLGDVLDVELQNAAQPQAGPFIDVSLNDGSLLHCADFALKQREVSLRLLSGQEVKLPLAAVSYVLRDAHDPANRQEWQRLLTKQGERDLIAVKKEKESTANPLPGTLGAGDDTGEKIEFELNGNKNYPLLKRIHGMSFYRRLGAPDVLCKAYDTTKNELVVGKIARANGGYIITTASGVTIEYPLPQLARLDFSKGKLTFLSDLEPIKKIESANLGGLDHYRRDKNLDGGTLMLAGKPFVKGLAMHAYSELVYDIGGEYKDFKAKLGMDDQVGGDGAVKVVIEGDNKEIFTAEVSRKTKEAINVAVGVRNVKHLKITVNSLGLFDLGAHVDIVDAKVSK